MLRADGEFVNVFAYSIFLIIYFPSKILKKNKNMPLLHVPVTFFTL